MTIFRSLTFYFALIGIFLACVLIKKLTTPGPEPLHLMPAINPYSTTIAAAGIIEAIDKNIELGIPQSGLVKEVYVKVGDPVKQNQLLFRLDDREFLAQLLVQKANVGVAQANVTRLKDQLARLETVKDPRAISQEELATSRHHVEIAIAEQEAAQAQVTQTILMIDRLSICAPQNGVILQNNIRKGEFVTAGGAPTILLGDIEHLQVRAEVDEQNASSVMSQSPATAFPKNNALLEIPLRFERIEPYVVPKRALTGAGNERVDTRVLQVIYSFDRPSHFPLYVGQQVDIFIEHPELETLAQQQESSANVP